MRYAWAVLASCGAFMCQVFATLHPHAIMQHPTDFLGLWISSLLMFDSARRFERAGRR